MFGFRWKAHAIHRGTYTVSASQTVASEAMTTTNSIETSWFIATDADAGGLVKITSTNLG